MARKHKIDYYEMFIKTSDYAVQYAQELVAFLESHFDEDAGTGTFAPSEPLLKLQELHAIEEAADSVTHEVITNLAGEFVTPIEREDILSLAEQLDDLVDDIDEVLQRIHMYCVWEFTPEVLTMARTMLQATEAVQVTCTKLTYFKKSNSINDYIVRIHDCEDEGDVIFTRAVHKVFERAMSGQLSTSAFAYGIERVLTSLEKCCDRAETVGNTITTVITKNS